MSSKKIILSLIQLKGKSSKPFNNIIKALNGYLLRNKGAVSDFTLIKDIVDRNVDNEEDSISSNLPIPLYLGLIGTMLGIIIGLIAMPSLSESFIGSGDTQEKTMQGVDALLSGVKIAMIASATGLLLTTINSLTFYYYRRKTEEEKNNFFTFIQTQLLPILSKNTASSIQTLQANLLKFNEGFAQNMGQFDGVIREVRTTFQSQLQVVEELKRIDVSNMAKYNIDVMKQLNTSFNKLKDLSTYLSSVNGLLKNTEQLNLTVSKQLDKVGDIGTIVENFDTNAQGLVAGSKYLESHFQNFDQREQTISNKIADFDSKTGDMVDELKKSFEERLKTFNEKDVDINSGFEELFANLKETTAQVFEDESQNIGAIKKEMAVVSERVNRMQSIPSNVDELDKRIKSQNESLEKLVEKIADKPLVFKPPKLLIIFFIVIGLIIIATCGLFIYKYIL
jgi:hypothetical protein